jgi:hypothetical protein
MTIYSYLQGGLGNQLFQYAIARALSEQYQVGIALDRSWFDTQHEGATPRQFQLDLLNIPQINYSKDLFPKKTGRLRSFVQNYLSNDAFVFYQKSAFDFDSRLLHLKNIRNRNLYLFGYWQGFRYIQSIHSILQKDFELRAEISTHYQPLLKKIIASESIMLHIRRGDYVSSPSAAQIHGALSIDYYLKAIEVMQLRKSDGHFFIFSDDLAWARTMLPANLPVTFIENSADENAAAQELQLMRACKNHIIANSSLSWWGAWLTNNSDGLVIAPNRWMADSSLDLGNLLPSKWYRLPA